jgi:hypothetical protein
MTDHDLMSFFFCNAHTNFISFRLELFTMGDWKLSLPNLLCMMNQEMLLYQQYQPPLVLLHHVVHVYKFLVAVSNYLEVQFNVLFVCLMVFNATFNSISVISLRSVLLVQETGGPGENHRQISQVTDKLCHIMLYTSP